MKKSLKWLSKQTKRSLSLLVILTFGISLMSTDAQARLIFTTEEDGVEVNAYTLDVDGSVNLTDNTDLSLNFGGNLGASLTYNDSTSQFTFNKDVNLSGKQLKNFLVENSAADPAVCSAALEGRMYQNTTDNELYYCNGTAWKSTSSLGVGSVTTTEILDGTIATVDIANNAITAAKIATGAVTTTEILDGTIVTGDIATDTILAGNIAANAVTASELADNAVDTAAIAANAVTAAKIATGAVTTTEILDGTIASVDIAANAVTAAKIATGAVTTTEILDGTIATADVADDAITAAKIDSASAGNDKVLTTDGTGANTWVNRSTFGTSSLTSANIFVGNVGGTATGVAVSGDITMDNTGNFQLAASSVTTTEILDGTIATVDIADNAITTAKIAADTIIAADIATGAVTTAEILDGTIATVDIADNAITTAKIAADTIIAADIATGAVTTDEILDGTIAFADIASRNATDVVPPEYPNFTLTADGTANRGTFESDYDAVDKRNYYKWSTRKTVQQDYDMVVQWPVPENFQGFQAVNPFQFDYKTSNVLTADNKIDIVSILGTDGLTVTPTGSTAALTSTTWATGNVQFGGGTFTPGQFITINFKLHARKNGTKQASQLGALKFNYLAK